MNIRTHLKPITYVHFYVESFDPRRGGMEGSAARLVQYFESDPQIRFIGHVIRPHDKTKSPRGLARVFDLDKEARALLEPLVPANTVLEISHSTRLHILMGTQILQKLLQKHPQDRHVLLSYYLPTAGFIAQNLACQLNLPHIACSRGSDLGHDVFYKDIVPGIEFVAKRASCLVTTNLQHEQIARRVCGREGEICTIYNGLQKNVRPHWRRQKNARVRLVSAIGYCVKKGTHLLVEAVKQLIEEGLPIELVIVGPTRIGNWDRFFRQMYATGYNDLIRMKGQIEPDKIKSFLLHGDIYCSAALSEGCSNATMLALGLGMPIVSTATGALRDLATEMDHVDMVAAASITELMTAIRRMVRKILNGSLVVNNDRVGEIVKRLSADREHSDWKELLMRFAVERNSAT
jgi:glycosyltransferase involved in cell wall biosynthesis